MSFRSRVDRLKPTSNSKHYGINSLARKQGICRKLSSQLISHIREFPIQIWVNCSLSKQLDPIPDTAFHCVPVGRKTASSAALKRCDRDAGPQPGNLIHEWSERCPIRRSRREVLSLDFYASTIANTDGCPIRVLPRVSSSCSRE